CRIGVTDAAEPVVVVAEQVRVDRADADAALLGMAAKGRPIVDAVPGDVERHGRTTAGETVDERGVVDPLPDGPRGARPRIDVEAGAGVAVPPRRRLDRERLEPREHVALGHGASLTHRRPNYESTFDCTSFGSLYETIDLRATRA